MITFWLKWQSGTIKQVLWDKHLLVDVRDHVWKCHIDQLLPLNIEDSQISPRFPNNNVDSTQTFSKSHSVVIIESDVVRPTEWNQPISITQKKILELHLHFIIQFQFVVV